MKIYAVEGVSYDSCNGWTSWIMKDTITTSCEKAKQMAKDYKSAYIKTNVIVVTEE